MKTYVVNLPRSRERRESILAECARFGLTPEILPCIDSKETTEAEIRRLVSDPEKNPLTRSEICCTLNHVDFYRDMVAKDIPYALILEDDSVFALDPQQLLAGFEPSMADAPDIYLLTHRSNQYISGDERRIGGVCFYRGWGGTGSNGYVITKSAAANLLRFQTPIRFVCDWWKLFRMYGLIEFYVPEREFVGLHQELGADAVSLLEEARHARSVSMGKRYFRYFRRQVPLRFRARHLFDKLRYWRRLRHQ